MVMNTLHDGHPGMARMKSLLQCFVWWLSMVSLLCELPAILNVRPLLPKTFSDQHSQYEVWFKGVVAVPMGGLKF